MTYRMVLQWLDTAFPGPVASALGILTAALAVLSLLNRRVVRRLFSAYRRGRHLRSAAIEEELMYRQDAEYLSKFATFMRAERWDPRRYVSPDLHVKERANEPETPVMLVQDSASRDALTPDMDLQDRRERVASRRTRNLLTEALALKHVVLLGEPGSGKTVALITLGIDAARRGLDSSSVRPVVPVFIPLNEFIAPFTGVDPTAVVLDFVYKQVVKVSGAGSTAVADRLRSLLRDNRLLLIFDALDEMPRDDYYERFRALVAFVHAHPGNSFVFSCRVTDYIDDISFPMQQIILSPFTDRQIRRLFKRYLGRNWAVAYRQVFASPSILGIQARSPFFLSLVAYCVEAGVPPGGSWDSVIRNYVELVVSAESRRRIADEPQSIANLSETTAWLRELAFKLVTMRATGTVADAALVRRTLARSGKGRSPLDISLSCGILRDTGRGSVRFQHHRIQEYYAALRLADLIDQHRSSVSSYLDDLWWQEVFVMAAALSNHPELLIDAIIDQSLRAVGPRYTDLRRDFNRLLLAMRCYLPAQQKLPLHTRQTMIQRLVQVLELGNMLQRVKALRVAPQFSDRRVATAVRNNMLNPIRWVRENAIFAYATMSAGHHAGLRGFGYQMFRMMSSEGSLLQGVRDFPVFLRHRGSRRFLPLFLGLVMLGLVRSGWSLFLLYAVLGFSVVYGVLTAPDAIVFAVLVPGVYLAARWLARRSTGWSVRPRSLNVWALSCIFWGTVWQSITLAARQAEATTPRFVSILIVVVYGIASLLVYAFALRNVDRLIGASFKVFVVWRRSILTAASPIQPASTAAGRVDQARRLIEAAQAETSPMARSRQIRRIVSLVPLDDEVLADLDDFINQEIDNDVKSDAWEVYDQIDEAIRRGAAGPTNLI